MIFSLYGTANEESAEPSEAGCFVQVNWRSTSASESAFADCAKAAYLLFNITFIVITMAGNRTRRGLWSP